MREVFALVSATGTQQAARHTDRVVVLVRVTHDLSRLALLQSEVNPLRSDLFVLGEVKQLAQRVLGILRLSTGDAKSIAAPADLHVQPGLQQTQIFIERTTEIREPRVIGGL
jgi:hypothetical protein